MSALTEAWRQIFAVNIAAIADPAHGSKDPITSRFGRYRVVNRLESHLGEVEIEFPHFRRLRNEAGIRHFGVFELDLNHAIERLGTQQLFDEGKAVIY